ncbi:epimerase [Phyllobacterium brassicacearum]|uniref:Epimerase n=1 Tax=Phyllobacterium brassicacearum TaxID=314235 RepID=A0A2P7BBF6_9HYPH|nr:GDP-mannose 4,6-dehydratase [Phyllobacterium brassicacearum]PSH63749.1 epimerase [Phyllobacterium brassicacearum]TDQ31969.1 GDP-4-dehydro-6-deoxy-D-mannose reductase [Phyllobacterium brassicacearum]
MAIEHRVLITGGNGFVGSWLQRELEARRQNQSILVLPVGHGLLSGRNVDVTDNEQVLQLVHDFRPTSVVHLAAVAAATDASRAPRRAWDINFTGTMNLAYATMEAAPDARFIFVSSSEVYGASFIDSGGVPLTEDAALKPMNVYGATKAAADILVGELAYEGLNAIRFRPFNHTGPGQTDAYVVAAFAKQLVEISAGLKPPVMHVGNLLAYRDFLDVRDVVRAYADAALAENPEAYGKAFNLASGKPRQIQSILDTLIRLSGLKIEVHVDPQRLRSSEVASASGDAGAVQSVLDWQPNIDFEETLADVFDDWKARMPAP